MLVLISGVKLGIDSSVRRERLLIYFNCVVTVGVSSSWIMVPWVGLLSVVVAFPGHTHLLFISLIKYHKIEV